MLKKRARPKRKPRTKPNPTIKIPDGIKKGDPVLYMLERVGHSKAVLVTHFVTNRNRKYETYLLDLFKSDAIRMTPKVKAPGLFSRYQVKFGITSNLQQRLEDINDNIFESGVTEWRKISWLGFLIALFNFWWFKHSGKVYLVLLLGFVLGWMILFN